MSRCRWIARLLPCHRKVQLELWFRFNVMIFKIYRIDKDVWTKKDSTTEPFSKCGRDAVIHTFTSSLIYYSLSSGIWISYEATSSSVCQMPSGPPWIASGFNKAADEGRIFDEEKFSSELLCGLMDVSTWIMQCHWHVMPNKTTQKRQPVSFKVYRKKRVTSPWRQLSTRKDLRDTFFCLLYKVDLWV